MSSFKEALTSTLGKKLIMSLTGLFLCSFLIVHLVGNLQLFNDDEGFAFNQYAHFMTNFGPIKVVSYLLYASIVIHALYALILTIYNKKARPIGYDQKPGNKNSTWNSRNMGILGTVLLVFIATHMYNFWWQFHNDHVPYIQYETNTNTGQTSAIELPAEEFTGYKEFSEEGVNYLQAKDLYKQVEFAFKNLPLVIFYVLSMAALSFHLIHGFRSAFQSLGFDHKKYVPIVKFLAIYFFGIVVPVGFAAMPIYFYFK